MIWICSTIYCTSLYNQGADYVHRLLKGQAALVRKLPIERRLNACFLGRVDLSDSSEHIDHNLLENIRNVG